MTLPNRAVHDRPPGTSPSRLIPAGSAQMFVRMSYSQSIVRPTKTSPPAVLHIALVHIALPSLVYTPIDPNPTTHNPQGYPARTRAGTARVTASISPTG